MDSGTTYYSTSFYTLFFTSWIQFCRICTHAEWYKNNLSFDAITCLYACANTFGYTHNFQLQHQTALAENSDVFKRMTCSEVCVLSLNQHRGMHRIAVRAWLEVLNQSLFSLYIHHRFNLQYIVLNPTECTLVLYVLSMWLNQNQHRWWLNCLLVQFPTGKWSKSKWGWVNVQYWQK